jgi:hypothetical protein
MASARGRLFVIAGGFTICACDICKNCCGSAVCEEGIGAWSAWRSGAAADMLTSIEGYACSRKALEPVLFVALASEESFEAASSESLNNCGD